jgi:hypothetical protein
VGNAGPAQRSPNLAAIIQEIVNRSGWSSGNALALFVNGSGTRVAVAHNQNPAAAPLLHVEWMVNQAPVVNAGSDQTITLPAGANLDATVSDDGKPTPPALTYAWSQDSGPAGGTATFATPSAEDTGVTFNLDGVYDLRLTVSDGDLSNSDVVRVTVQPEPPNQAPVVNAGSDQTITLPAGASLDATVTDDGKPTPPSITYTWSQTGGTGVATFATPSAEDTTVTFSQADTYTLRLTASDGALSGFDELIVTVNSQPPTNVLEIRVSANPDDAEETTANVVQRGDGDLDMMNDSNGNKLVVGTRFLGVAIPQGATITNAYLQFQADEAHSVATNLTIRGQAADNPSTFSTTNGDLSSRPTTAASQAWTVDPWLAVGDAGPAQRSPNLAAIIQQIVSRPGWASGNALVLLVTGSGQRVAVAHNQTPAAAPLLHIEWTTGSAASTYRVPSVGVRPSQAFADANAIDRIASFPRAGVWRLLFTFIFLGTVAAGIVSSARPARPAR